MKKIKRQIQLNFDSQSFFLIFVTFFGLLLLVAMYLWSLKPETSYYSQNPMILSIFIMICIMGILAAIYPSKCAGFFKFRNEINVTSSNGNSIRFSGHHPDCGKFKHHTIIIYGKRYCPGCLGLSIGAFLAIVGILFYYFSGLTGEHGQIYFYIGIIIVLFTMILIIFFNMGKRIKFILNLALVLGSFLILLGVSLKGNILVEIYFLILISFWIFTRIRVSQTHHEKVCHDCLKEADCIYT